MVQCGLICGVVWCIFFVSQKTFVLAGDMCHSNTLLCGWWCKKNRTTPPRWCSVLWWGPTLFCTDQTATFTAKTTAPTYCSLEAQGIQKLQERFKLNWEKFQNNLNLLPGVTCEQVSRKKWTKCGFWENDNGNPTTLKLLNLELCDLWSFGPIQ